MNTIVKQKKGYKKTKLGWIPEEWEVATLEKNTLKIGSGSTPRGGDKIYLKNGIRFIRSQNINNNKLLLKNTKYIPEDIHLKMKGTIVKPNDVLLNITGASLGRSCVVPSCFNEGNVNQHVCIIRTIKNRLSPSFLQFYISSFNGQKSILREQAGGNREGLSKKNVEEFKIPLPPLPEQKKIAEILSTWDKAIEQTQVLINQLQQRKKGLMQQLLTGKKRLPSFSGEWEVIRGGDLFNSVSNKKHKGNLEVLSATQDKGVIPRKETGIDIKYDKSSLSNYKLIEAGDFVISLRSFQGGIEYSNYTGLVSPAYTVLRERIPIAKTFYKDYMKTQTFINKLNSIIYGIRDGKQISYKEFSTLKFLYPKLAEQKAIAQVLTKSDEEIHQVQAYLSTLESQKKGLMQQLLTGQRRVKIDKN